MHKDFGLDCLLDLDGVIIEQKAGCWVKFDVAKLGKVTKERPHGIKYSLSLHDRDGERLLGFDNAHAIKSGGQNNRKKLTTYDHVHKNHKGKIEPYNYIDAYRLLKDFWEAVEQVLNILVENSHEKKDSRHRHYASA